MATVIGKNELCRIHDVRKYFKAFQGIQGKTLFDRYAALANVVNSNIDPGFQDFLAHPVQDGDVITFYAKKYQETPQVLTDLQGEDLKKYNGLKDTAIEHYNCLLYTSRCV